MDLDGGQLEINWQSDGVWMTGETAHSFDGHFNRRVFKDMSIPKFVTLGCRLNTYETEAMRELVNNENLKNIAVLTLARLPLKLFENLNKKFEKFIEKIQRLKL